NKEVFKCVYQATRAIDPMRPIIDTSGYVHVKTDIYDVHNYDQNPETFRENYEPLKEGKPPLRENTYIHIHSTPEMSFVSEYGGIGWSVGDKAWSYGNAPKTEEEFIARLKGLTDVLLDNPMLSAYCYTQLTDVEQEQNGLYTYARQPKFPPEIIHEILARKAAIEE
ncbi:MAG: beta-galactosidase, partial [Clostridia bacterium]|nr:beta-galactosidase [Clostridia bacterium]